MSQFELFPSNEVRAPSGPNPEEIRLRLMAVLEELRRANAMPWSPGELRDWRCFVPQMTNWLPADEAESVRQEFSAHLERLDA